MSEAAVVEKPAPAEATGTKDGDVAETKPEAVGAKGTDGAVELQTGETEGETSGEEDDEAKASREYQMRTEAKGFVDDLKTLRSPQ